MKKSLKDGSEPSFCNAMYVKVCQPEFLGHCSQHLNYRVRG